MNNSAEIRTQKVAEERGPTWPINSAGVVSATQEASPSKGLLEELLHHLTPRERTFLKLRYGLNGNRSHFVPELASIFNIPVEGAVGNA